MEWIPVNKHKPKPDTDVLLYTDEGVIQGYYNVRDMKFECLQMGFHGCGCCGGEEPEITHWAEIKPPEGVNNNEVVAS